MVDLGRLMLLGSAQTVEYKCRRFLFLFFFAQLLAFYLNTCIRAIKTTSSLPDTSRCTVFDTPQTGVCRSESLHEYQNPTVLNFRSSAYRMQLTQSAQAESCVYSSRVLRNA